MFFKTGVVCNFIKETLAQVFTFEFCEISKNTFSYRTPLMAASEEFWQLRALTSRNEVKAIKSINSIKSVGKYYYEIESWLQQVPLVMEKSHQSECLQLLHQRRKAKKIKNMHQKYPKSTFFSALQSYLILLILLIHKNLLCILFIISRNLKTVNFFPVPFLFFLPFFLVYFSFL